jgi:hypothetical protein
VLNTKKTLRQRGRIFNQREQIELKQIISSLNMPMSFIVDTETNAINLDFKGTVYIQSILVKNNEGYRIDYTNSNGDDKFFENKEWNNFKYHVRKWIEAIKRDNPYEPNRKENIDEISPEFYKIFREATIINQLGFKDSSGMIFRKALEIIVKDFLKDYFPNTFENLISKKTIGQIFRHFYDIKSDEIIIKEKKEFSNIQEELQGLKSLANIINNTFQIGNDFSHYERRLFEFSAENMQERIIKIADFIDGKIEMDRMLSKHKKMNAEFGADKLSG